MASQGRKSTQELKVNIGNIIGTKPSLECDTNNYSLFPRYITYFKI